MCGGHIGPNNAINTNHHAPRLDACLNRGDDLSGVAVRNLSLHNTCLKEVHGPRMCVHACTVPATSRRTWIALSTSA
jgi:hypothetical protein